MFFNAITLSAQQLELSEHILYTFIRSLSYIMEIFITAVRPFNQDVLFSFVYEPDIFYVLFMKKH